MSQLWSEKVNRLISSASAVAHSYQPSQSIIKLLSNGSIYIKSDMDTDADGSPRAKQIDPFGLPETSLSRDNGWRGDGRFVNAETIPYFVLPGKFNLVFGTRSKLGDLALIRRRDAEVFAIYADIGPKTKIGEGSIKLVESLGANPWNRTKTKIISGIEFGVEYLVFPRSSETFGIPTDFEKVQKIGQQAFESLFGE
jgi:hypothetical protein